MSTSFENAATDLANESAAGDDDGSAGERRSASEGEGHEAADDDPFEMLRC